MLAIGYQLTDIVVLNDLLESGLAGDLGLELFDFAAHRLWSLEGVLSSRSR